MLISKKDLLNETGISYGQLYRWKREGLIPEDWFIKQPSFTGQETFFPKAKILNRINAIQKLKDQYSLDELAKILSPEIADRFFTDKELEIIDEIDKGLIPCFCKIFEKSSFSFVEVLLLTSISSFKNECNLQLIDIEKICIGIKSHIENLKQTDYLCVLFKYNDEYLMAIYDEKSEVHFDDRIKTISTVRLNDISSNIKVKYRKSFNFRFDDTADECPEMNGGKVVLV